MGNLIEDVLDVGIWIWYGCVFSLTSVPGPRKPPRIFVGRFVIFLKIFAKADTLHGKDCWPSKSLVWFQSVVTCVVQRLGTSLMQRSWLWRPFGYWMWGAIWLWKIWLDVFLEDCLPLELTVSCWWCVFIWIVACTMGEGMKMNGNERISCQDLWRVWLWFIVISMKTVTCSFCRIYCSPLLHSLNQVQGSIWFHQGDTGLMSWL